MNTEYSPIAVIASLIAVAAGWGAALFIEPVVVAGATLLPLVTSVGLATAGAGAGAGLLALLANAAFAAWFLFDPRGQWSVVATPDQTALAIYALSAVIVLLGVAALRAARQRAERVTQLLDTTFDQIGDGLLTCDASGRVARMNRAAERYTGWRELDARGRPLAQILRYADAPATSLRPCEPLLAPGPAAVSVIASDGSERPVALSIADLHLPGGDGGRVHVLHDVAHWQRTARELREFATELWAANQRKDETLAALAGLQPAAAAISVSGDDPMSHLSEPASPLPAPMVAPADNFDPNTQPVDEDGEAVADCRVLMLCEDSDSAFALSMLLGMAGYDVKTARSSPDALRQAAQFAPDFALIDTTVPGTDSLAAARALRGLRGDLELVALTSAESAADSRLLEDVGFSVALPKSEPLALKRWLATRRAA